MTGVIFQLHDGGQTLSKLEELTDFYQAIHDENPAKYSHEKFSRSAFISRTKSQAQVGGFVLATAALDNELIGFSFGYPFSPEQWWRNCTPAPEELLNSPKFAVIELNVQKYHRRQGIAKKLMAELLSERPEKFATLSVRTESDANAMYLRWGWYKVGFFTTPPPMDALVLTLDLQPLEAP